MASSSFLRSSSAVVPSSSPRLRYFSPSSRLHSPNLSPTWFQASFELSAMSSPLRSWAIESTHARRRPPHGSRRVSAYRMAASSSRSLTGPSAPIGSGSTARFSTVTISSRLAAEWGGSPSAGPRGTADLIARAVRVTGATVTRVRAGEMASAVRITIGRRPWPSGRYAQWTAPRFTRDRRQRPAASAPPRAEGLRVGDPLVGLDGGAVLLLPIQVSEVSRDGSPDQLAPAHLGPGGPPVELGHEPVVELHQHLLPGHAGDHII